MYEKNHHYLDDTQSNCPWSAQKSIVSVHMPFQADGQRTRKQNHNHVRKKEQEKPDHDPRLIFLFTIGRSIHHLLLRREHFLDRGQGVSLAHQPRHINRREINAVILAVFLHDLGRAQHHASARLAVFPEDAREFRGGFSELWLRTGHIGQAHAHADVEGAEPDDVNVRDGGEDVVEVVDCLEGFDLDHDGGLAVQILLDGGAGVAGRVGDARDEAEGRGGAGAVVSGAEFGGGGGVLGFGDGVDLWDDD